jgi:g-D-glutamyl-meso-diaminopimelate peptidase
MTMRRMFMKVQVRPGDTFWLYSQLFRIPVQLIEDSNPHVLPTSLMVGQTINIPGFIAEEYMIQQGDTISKLAKERNLAIDTIFLLNPNLNPNRLQINDRILLPRLVTDFVVDGNEAYDFGKLEKDLHRLVEIYPFLKVNRIGDSVLGKPLYEIEMGRGNRTIHFNASFHANEWITTPVLMRLLNEFIVSLVRGNPIRRIFTLPLYNRNRLSIVPMVNPDGVDLVLHGPPEEMKEELIAMNKGSLDFSGWKANIRGVDLNNQYPAYWEIEKKRKEPKSPAPRDYPGDEPLTEPEVMAMADLAQRKQFARLLAFHTQGREFYWGYENLEPPESEVLANEFAKVSGYDSVRYIDSHAGYKDWFIYIYRRPGFTFELGYGVNPLPITQFPQIYDEMLGVFLAALYM